MKWLRWFVYRVRERLRVLPFAGSVREGQPFCPDERVQAQLSAAPGMGNSDLIHKEWVDAIVTDCRWISAAPFSGDFSRWEVRVVPDHPTAGEWERIWWPRLHYSYGAQCVDAKDVRRRNIIDLLASLDGPGRS